MQANPSAVSSAAQPSITKWPVEYSLTSSDALLGQQWIFNGAVSVQLREAKAPNGAARRKMAIDFIFAS